MGLFTDGFKLLKKASEPLHKTPKYIQETIEILRWLKTAFIAFVNGLQWFINAGIIQVACS